MMAGIAAAVPGNHIEDISAAVQAVAAKANLGVIRQFVGHGIGTEMHEEPQVPNSGPVARAASFEAGLWPGHRADVHPRRLRHPHPAG